MIVEQFKQARSIQSNHKRSVLSVYLVREHRQHAAMAIRLGDLERIKAP